MKRILQSPQNSISPMLISLILAILLGGFIRMAPVFSADFPIKDGGLFFAFIDQILQSHFSLPLTISYNGLTIPFAYPPLSFYLTAILSSTLNIPIIILIRFIPAIFSILTIVAFYRLASTILESERQVCIAVLSFALLPTAVDFMIVGGGLPRSMAYFFAILAFQQTWKLFTKGDRIHLVWSIVWTGLTILTHPVVAKFLIYSLLVIFLFKGRTSNSFLRFLGIGFSALIWTSPWWLLVISRHGIAPYLNAFQAAPQPWTSYLAALLFMQTNEPYLHIQGLLALIGVFVCLNFRNFWPPAWLAAVFLLEPRLVASYSILPTTFLVAIALDFLINSLNTLKANSRSVPTLPQEFSTNTAITGTTKLMLGFFLTYALVSAYIVAPRQSLSSENRHAMAWIKANLPPNSQFLVISGINGAGEDYVAEWFPVLSGSTSLSTPQGMEWLPGGEFNNLWESHDALKACTIKDEVCLDTWTKSNDIQYQYVYLNTTPGKSDNLYNSLKNSKYKNEFENAEVVIFSQNP